MDEWIDTTLKLEGRGPRLWNVVSNYYVKTFSGWQGGSTRIGRDDLEAAKRALDEFHVILITGTSHVLPCCAMPVSRLPAQATTQPFIHPAQSGCLTRLRFRGLATVRLAQIRCSCYLSYRGPRDYSSIPRITCFYALPFPSSPPLRPSFLPTCRRLASTHRPGHVQSSVFRRNLVSRANTRSLVTS